MDLLFANIEVSPTIKEFKKVSKKLIERGKSIERSYKSQSFFFDTVNTLSKAVKELENKRKEIKRANKESKKMDFNLISSYYLLVQNWFDIKEKEMEMIQLFMQKCKKNGFSFFGSPNTKQKIQKINPMTKTDPKKEEKMDLYVSIELDIDGSQFKAENDTTKLKKSWIYDKKFVEDFSILPNLFTKCFTKFSNIIFIRNRDLAYIEEHISGKIFIDKENKRKMIMVENCSWFENGKGTTNYADGTIYDGEYKNGLKNGKGKFYRRNGAIYYGSWENDLPHGHGTYTYPNGSRFEGEFKNGYYHGQGTFIYPNGNMYRGKFENGKENGYGVFEFAKSGNTYTGFFKDGVREGEGNLMHLDGSLFIGTWKNDKKNGPGVVYKGNDIFKGFWKNGKRVKIQTIDDKEEQEKLISNITSQKSGCNSKERKRLNHKPLRIGDYQKMKFQKIVY